MFIQAGRTYSSWFPTHLIFPEKEPAQEDRGVVTARKTAAFEENSKN